MEDVNTNYKVLDHIGGMPLLEYDANRNKSQFYVKDMPDCAIRALSAATDISYDETALFITQVAEKLENQMNRPLPTPELGTGTSMVVVEAFLRAIDWDLFIYTKDKEFDLEAVEHINKQGYLDSDFKHTSFDAFAHTQGRPFLRGLLPNKNAIVILNNHVVYVKEHCIYDTGFQIKSPKRTRLMRGFFWNPEEYTI